MSVVDAQRVPADLRSQGAKFEPPAPVCPPLIERYPRQPICALSASDIPGPFYQPPRIWRVGRGQLAL